MQGKPESSVGAIATALNVRGGRNATAEQIDAGGSTLGSVK